MIMTTTAKNKVHINSPEVRRKIARGKTEARLTRAMTNPVFAPKT